MNDQKLSSFWKKENDEITIQHYKLLMFIYSNGFMRVKLSPSNYLLVKKQNNRIRVSSEDEILEFIGEYLQDNDEIAVYEKFVKGIGSYFQKKKLSLLKSIKQPNDRDDKSSGIFYFQNCYYTVTKDDYVKNEYENLPFVIWENRIINHEFNFIENEVGQFEKFCRNITNKNEERFLALKSILGYLIHRNKDNGEAKAVILYDEKMQFNDKANGGTGKSLLSQALSKVRELEVFDGKSIKSDSWFKNQRLNITTDIITYDDLHKSTSLELFYTMITAGVEVEKKHKDAFYIDFKNSPKILITSNYPVKGPGGSSDLRRRFEFELTNHYDQDFTPENDFGNRFFDNEWSQEEWQLFYQFMMDCLRLYLKKGLIELSSANIERKKFENKTSKEFVEFSSEFIVLNQWNDKRELEEFYSGCYSEDITPHRFKKWLKAYSNYLGAKFDIKSSGGSYIFKITKDD